MEAVWKKQYSLAELVAADQFKTYDELKKRLDYVLGSGSSSRIDPEVADEDEGSAPPLPSNLREELNNLAPSRPSYNSVDEDEDDTLSYFQKLAED
jgi:hypothetical protein